jgi:hypothetical protein
MTSRNFYNKDMQTLSLRIYSIVLSSGFTRLVLSSVLELPAMWKLKIHPRVHVFLWLLANNKLLNRDNLNKRQTVHDLTCVFCLEPDTTRKPL